MQTKKIKGIIIAKNPYLENDEILKVLTEDSLVYIRAKGVKKIESKNRPNVVLGSIVGFEIFTTYSTPTTFLLRKAILIKELPEITKTNAKKIETLIKIINNIRHFNLDVYNLYLLLINDFNDVNFFKTQSFLISKILESNGEGLSFCYCVICSTNQDLYNFDTYQGGMLCKKHGKYKTPVELLKAFYFLGVSLERYTEFASPTINKQIFGILSNLLF